MGMTKMQLMKDVELPLALPLIISGIRLSSVYVISWATLASYVGAGGLGDLVFNGLNLYQPPMIISLCNSCNVSGFTCRFHTFFN